MPDCANSRVASVLLLAGALLGCSDTHAPRGTSGQRGPAAPDRDGQVAPMHSGVAGGSPTRSVPALDGGPKIEPRDAQVDPHDAQVTVVADAKVVPPAEDPADCKVMSLTPAEACPAGDCALAFANEITCPGTLGGFELVAATDRAFAHVETSDRNGKWSHLVLRLPPESDAVAIAVPAMNARAVLRVAPDGEPALITIDSHSIVVRRTRTAPFDWQETFDDVQSVSDVLFDAEGRLVVFSGGSGASGQPVTFVRTLPGAPVEIIEPYASYARAVLLRDGNPALLYEVEENGKRVLMRWSEATGPAALTELSLRPIPNPLVRQAPAPDWSLVPTGAASDVIVSYARGNELFTRGLLSDALPALSWSAPLPGCDGMELAPYPDVCSDERMDEAAGEQLMAHQLALGTGDTPYLFSVVGEAQRICEWKDPRGCIETRTCDCRQFSLFDFQSLTLDVRALGLGTQRFRLPLPSVKHVKLAAASRGDGIVVVAVAYGEQDYQAPPTHLRLYGIDTR